MCISQEKNRIALVTGGAVRVGRAIAVALAEMGYDLIVHYRSSAESAKSLEETISQIGRRIWLVRADLASQQGIYETVRGVKQITGHLDVLVNNASTFPASCFPGQSNEKANKSILEETWDSWDNAIAVNARAPFFLIQELFPLLRVGENPTVVNILDSSVSEVYPSRASHTVSKWALAAITDLASHTVFPPVRVNALELGRVSFDDSPIDVPYGGGYVRIGQVISGFVSLVTDTSQNGKRLVLNSKLIGQD